MTIAAGIDVGTGAVKAALFKVESGKETWLSRSVLRIRQRDPIEMARVAYDNALEDAEASTARGRLRRDHGRGRERAFPHRAFLLDDDRMPAARSISIRKSRAALDIGALHGRAISIDERGKVLSYKMTSQCASGSGQFLENIARYLGIAQEEIGVLSRQADNPEVVSSICAVLAETDVINMVSRGISASNILKGIHLSMAARLSKLLEVGGSDRWRGDGDRRACARQRACRGARRGYLPYQGHEGRRSQPSRFDLRRRDRSCAVGCVPVREAGRLGRAAEGGMNLKRRTTWR